MDQIDNVQSWWQANAQMNSIGMLITHLCGSFRQWMISIMNNEVDARNRLAEFINNKNINKETLVKLVLKLESDYKTAIDNFDTSRFLEQRRIQGYKVTIMSANIRALTHLEGHIGQIVLLTRIQLGDAYKIFWTPKTPEEISARILKR